MWWISKTIAYLPSMSDLLVVEKYAMINSDALIAYVHSSIT